MAASMEGSRAVAEGSEPVAVTSSETFEDFYVREFPAVVGLAYALSGSRSGAEDLAQEAFLAAHRGWDRVGSYDQPGVWVRRVVANLSVSVFRRRVVETKRSRGWRSGTRRLCPSSRRTTPSSGEAVRSLPRRQAQVIALHYLEDCPSPRSLASSGRPRAR